MKFVSPLSASDQDDLAALHRSGATHRLRQRAQAILLSAKGYTLDQLADILAADRDTVSHWMDLWQARGLSGLLDAPKSGRPKKLDAALREAIEDILEHPTPDLKAALAATLEKRGSASVGPPSGAACGHGATPSDEPVGRRPKPPTQRRRRAHSGR